MKILFVHNQYQFKGGEDSTLEMEESFLKGKGFQTKTLLFSNHKIGTSLIKLKAGLRSFYNKRSADLLKSEITLFKPDVIHIHNLFFEASPSILTTAKKMRIPVVYTAHNYRLLCSNALFLRNNQVCELCRHKTLPLEGVKYKCYRNSAAESALVTGVTGIHKLLNTWTENIDVMIALSGFMKTRLSDSSLKFPANRIVVKPNFVYDSGSAIGNRENFFLFVGRLSNEKGIDVLLNCFRNLPEHNLIIACDGPEKVKVLNHTREYPNIRYVGVQTKDQVLNLMKKSQALIFSSICYEGLPLTIVEAFSTGTPVIASHLGAMGEMITHLYNGYHFPPGNAEELKEAVKKFVAFTGMNPELMYLNARQTYLEKYTPEAHFDSITAIYEMAIKRTNLL
ncbi:MAG TPA: glycosyltransferase [Parasegetibacter sp.]